MTADFYRYHPARMDQAHNFPVTLLQQEQNPHHFDTTGGGTGATPDETDID